MQHSIPLDPANPHRDAMARAVETCVHCGFCLPACPTYKVLGEEMDSPRGRIVLMKEVLEGTLTLADVKPHIDRCLGCLGCVTACPSGVKYQDLIVPFRSGRETGARGPIERLQRRLLLDTLESPSLFRASARLGRAAKRVERLLPARLRSMVGLLPGELPKAVAVPSHTEAQGVKRARVALLTGCVQQALAPEIALATLRVLSANGVEVVVPPGQGCCGALALHSGEADRAYERADALARAFPTDVDAIVTNAAGCGSAMKEYGHAFRGRAHATALGTFGGRVRDVSEFLEALGLIAPAPLASPLTVAYHDACHLAHAQGIRRAPRVLLARVPNLQVVEVPDGDTCCGSAGLYNVEHPDIAAALGASKAEAIRATGAQAVAAGNIGCLVQIATHLSRAGASLPTLHTIQVLDRAYAAGRPKR
ncbi:(Fe-S)-binding protein [Luteitalea pratensis]|nr:heterodisulfide reductase-related iron-sulfur binding cluster [Luteitalea pratensis]